MVEEELILEEECPFCRSAIKTGATVCAKCGANKREFSGCGCVVALGIALGIAMSGLFAMTAVLDGDIGLALGGAGVALLLVAVVQKVWRYVSRPTWYRRMNV
ncbi:MAG: hypothetical protein OXG35_16495 [Acidobacteria bacterium]|nr:hypothetical protein [Acidobacteriota bacterium]